MTLSQSGLSQYSHYKRLDLFFIVFSFYFFISVSVYQYIFDFAGCTSLEQQVASVSAHVCWVLLESARLK